jgi:hypothetical protein
VLLTLIAIGGSAGPPAAALRLENMTDGRVFQFPMTDGERFAISYQHSIHDAPVKEEFVISEARRIVLVDVESSSAAVREYFGLLGPGTRHQVARTFDTLDFRVAMGEPQILLIGSRAFSFREFGAAGDRIQLRASCLSRLHARRDQSESLT